MWIANECCLQLLIVMIFSPFLLPYFYLWISYLPSSMHPLLGSRLLSWNSFFPSHISSSTWDTSAQGLSVDRQRFYVQWQVSLPKPKLAKTMLLWVPNELKLCGSHIKISAKWKAHTQDKKPLFFNQLLQAKVSLK